MATLPRVQQEARRTVSVVKPLGHMVHAMEPMVWDSVPMGQGLHPVAPSNDE